MSVSCDSQACSSLFTSASHSCGNSGECNYEVFYGDASFSKGKLGFESINFGDQNATFPNSIFGCGNENSMSGDRIENVTGLVGLGGGNVSLVSQIGDKIDHKFSYCLVPSNLTSTSKLQFGGDGIIIGREVVFTPLIIKSFAPTFYYLNLEEISVGQKSVKTGQNDGNIIIDSGTTLTLLEPSLYNDFVGLIKLVIGVEPEPIPPEPFDFCFTSSDDMHLTNIVFQFTQAKVVLNPQNFLIDYDSNLRCLAILSSPLQFSIFGNVAQTNFQVVYDLGAKKVSFAPTDCSKS
ncbi:hypothetical protein VNO78_13251 [Psophocarpus tetragonolobus]|uniref:Peptidase A1 domain-containing protein n=1 Tax=Psophocarpus tetragonolobus TaxID=3891 RepID=A0AAN9SX91_PSOTE